MVRMLIIASFGFLASGAVVASPDEGAVPMGGDYCGCPPVSACGKTAASCHASCSEYRVAACDCVDPDVVICSAYGPYGSFRNVCRCL
jgi:hypothetical protein